VGGVTSVKSLPKRRGFSPASAGKLSSPAESAGTSPRGRGDSNIVELSETSNVKNNEKIMSKLLKDTGEALYGSQWQSALARDLDISDRTMRRWVVGADNIPSGVAMDLWRLAEKRVALLDNVIERLKEAVRP